MTNIVLASSSTARKFLLKRLLTDFISANPDCDETALKGESHDHLAGRLGQQKAESLAMQYKHHLIIGSDQVATFDGIEALGKPMTHEAAFLQLKRASDQTLTFYTSICLLNSETGAVQTDIVTTNVKFKPLSDAQIHAYLQKEDVRFCAGSFKAESLGLALVQQIESTDPSSLIGLPLIRLTEFLMQEGIDPLLL